MILCKGEIEITCMEFLRDTFDRIYYLSYHYNKTMKMLMTYDVALPLILRSIYATVVVKLPNQSSIAYVESAIGMKYIIDSQVNKTDSNEIVVTYTIDLSILLAHMGKGYNYPEFSEINQIEINRVVRESILQSLIESISSRIKDVKAIKRLNTTNILKEYRNAFVGWNRIYDKYLAIEPIFSAFLPSGSLLKDKFEEVEHAPDALLLLLRNENEFQSDLNKWAAKLNKIGGYRTAKEARQMFPLVIVAEAYNSIVTMASVYGTLTSIPEVYEPDKTIIRHEDIKHTGNYHFMAMTIRNWKSLRLHESSRENAKVLSQSGWLNGIFSVYNF